MSEGTTRETKAPRSLEESDFAGFDAIDHRFDLVEARLEGIDKRLEQLQRTQDEEYQRWESLLRIIDDLNIHMRTEFSRCLKPNSAI